MADEADANAGEPEVYFDANGVPVVETPEQRSLRVHGDKLKSDYQLNACTSCSAEPVIYREVQNIGRFACRFHPGVLRRGAYSCCGWEPVIGYNMDGDPRHVTIRISRNQYGCVPCDHSPACVKMRGGPGFANPEGVSTRASKNARWIEGERATKIPLALIDYYMPEADAVLARRVNKDAPERSFAVVSRVDPQWLNKT